MNVTRADGQFNESQNILPAKIYQAALESLTKIKTSRYQKHQAECYLIYQIKGTNTCQTGLLCLANTKHLKKHELTRPCKVEDRMNLSQTIKCQISPVMLCTDSKDKLSSQIAKHIDTSKILLLLVLFTKFISSLKFNFILQNLLLVYSLMLPIISHKP